MEHQLDNRAPWQCPGCRTHYAPHVDRCDCASEVRAVKITPLIPYQPYYPVYPGWWDPAPAHPWNPSPFTYGTTGTTFSFPAEDS